MAGMIGFLGLLCVLLTPSSVWTASVAVEKEKHSKNIDILMPNVQPSVMDTYLCYSTKVESTFYITGFQPKATMEIAHHVLLYGCKVPGSTDQVWNCGEMQSNDNAFDQGPVCRDESNIIYAWAMDAPELHLPEGVGFKVGGDTPIQWIVLQVHYKDVSAFLPPRNEKDRSGVTLETTDIRQPKRAGVYLMGTLGEIPAHSTIYMETACSFNEQTELHPFAFRTHAHSHGKVISGYRVRDGNWKEIGRRSPQEPQMFYNVTNLGMTVKPGDILAARCTMMNNENISISIGSTSKDEMCNFYMMYYVDGDRIAKESYCFSPGPPEWNWFLQQSLHAENAPLNASIIPGTTELLKSTQKFLHEMENSMKQQKEKFQEEINELYNALRDYRQDTNIDNFPEVSNLVVEVPGQDLKRAEEFYQPNIDSTDLLEDGYSQY